MSRPRTFTPGEETAIRELYRSGIPMETIAATIKVRATRIREWVRGHEPPRGCINRREPTPEQRATILQMYYEGRTCPEISKVIGRSAPVITRWITGWELTWQHRPPSPEQTDILRQLFADGVAIKEICRHPQINRDWRAVAKWLQALGLDTEQRRIDQLRDRVEKALQAEQYRRERVISGHSCGCCGPSQATPPPKGSHGFTLAQEAKIRELFEAGESLKNIELTVRAGAPRLRAWLQANNLSRPRSSKIEATPEQRAEIERLYVAGVSINRISIITSCERGPLKRWLAEWGLYEVRRREEPEPEPEIKESRPKTIDCGRCDGAALWMNRAERYKCFKCRWESE